MHDEPERLSWQVLVLVSSRSSSPCQRTRQGVSPWPAGICHVAAFLDLGKTILLTEGHKLAPQTCYTTQWSRALA